MASAQMPSTLAAAALFLLNAVGCQASQAARARAGGGLVSMGGALIDQHHRSFPDYEIGEREHAAVSDVESHLSAKKKIRNDGHFLTKAELANISTIDCLEAAQDDPSVDCSNHTIEAVSTAVGYQSPWDLNQTDAELSAGNFPSYKDAVCHSHGDYLCDFSEVLDEKEQADIASLLKERREETPVQCGRLQEDKVDRRHYQPFYLGVAVIKDWPIESSSPDSLHQLGQIIGARWNMADLYVGDHIPQNWCPNTAMLLILTKNRQAYLSTDSCEFFCRDKGAPEVVTAVLSTLDDNQGVKAAVRAGIKAVYNVLSRDGAVSDLSSSSSSSSSGSNDGEEDSSTQVKYASSSVDGEDAWLTVLRIAYVAALVLMVAAMMLGAFVCYKAPGVALQLKK